MCGFCLRKSYNVHAGVAAQQRSGGKTSRRLRLHSCLNSHWFKTCLRAQAKNYICVPSLFFFFCLRLKISVSSTLLLQTRETPACDEQSSFGIAPLHYSAARRKMLDEIPKRGLTGAKPLWERKRRVRKIRISLLRWQSLHFAPVCEAEGGVLNPIAASLPFMPEYIKMYYFPNCFHTQTELLISYDSTF